MYIGVCGGGFDRVRGLERGEKNVCSDLGNGVT